MMKILFWLAIILIMYTYFIYPALLLLLRCVAPYYKDENNTEGYAPSVSMIISAYNEEMVIEEKIRNCLETDYPKEKLEVVVGSDGSSDKTDEIVEKYKEQGITLRRFDSRSGKVNVLNKIIPELKGEIIVLSDANTIYEPFAVKELIKHFSDRKVGCVCGKLLLKDAGDSSGGELEGVYWKYENVLKKLEGYWGSLLGANGGIYAIRNELFNPVPSNTIVEDFVIPMNILKRKFKVVYEENAVAYEETSKSIAEESIRRKRIGAGNYQALFLTKSMFNIFRGFPSFAFWSHKVLRWFVPFLLIMAFICNVLLMNEALYQYILILQSIFYLGGLVGWLLIRNKINLKVFSLLYYFISMNISLLLGFIRYILGMQKITWEKVMR